jgi:multiple sugar transport system substrate-binding protein
MSKKLSVFFSILMVVSMILAACAQGGQTTSAPQQPAETQAPATQPPAAAATQAPSGAPVSITLWHMEQPPYRVQRFQELIDEFNKTNPDIVVKQEPQNWGEIYTKAPAAFSAGNAPELLFAIPDFTPIMRAVGAVQPVEDFVNEMDAAHKYIPSAIAPYNYDGHIWAIPMWNMVQSLWYRKSVFEKADIQPPTTWDEWKAAAEKLTSEGQYGIGLPANKQLYTDQTTYDFMINAGAEEIYNADGTLRFDNPQTVNAFDFYNQLYQYSPPDSPNWTWGEAEACLASRTCAMVLQFTVITTYDQQAEGDPNDLGVVAIPHSSDVQQSGTIAYPNAVMVLTQDKAKQEAAYKFLRFLLQPENYGRFLNMEPGLYLPVTEDGGKADSYWKDPMIVKYKSQVETMLENSKNGMLFGFTGGHTFPSIAQISAQNMLAQVLQKVVIDKTPAADAVKQGQQMMEQAIQK